MSREKTRIVSGSGNGLNGLSPTVHAKSSFDIIGAASPPRLAIVEDDKGYRDLLARALARAGNYHCVGAYSTAEEAVQKLPGLNPVLVIVDVRLPAMDGIACVRHLRRASPPMKFVIITGERHDDAAIHARNAGADGFLVKPFVIAQCLAQLRFVLAQPQSKQLAAHGEAFSVPEIAAPGERYAGLSEREEEVIKCLAEGLLYKEVAERLGISEGMVHKRQHNAFGKLGAANRTEAVARWKSARAAG